MLDLLVPVGLCAGGWFLGGVNGTTAGAVVCLGGIGAPRAVGAWLRRTVRCEAPTRGRIIERSQPQHACLGPQTERPLKE
jgi:hypothetical protein